MDGHFWCNNHYDLFLRGLNTLVCRLSDVFHGLFHFIAYRVNSTIYWIIFVCDK